MIAFRVHTFDGDEKWAYSKRGFVTGQWVIAATITELSGNVHIASINCALQFAEVYDRVEFPEEEEEPEDE